MRIPGIRFVPGRNSYTDGDGRKYGIAIHNTSNTATAEQEASYATRRTDGISAHLYVDADSIVQSLDTRDRAGHAGSNNGNNHALAVEITGANGWTRQQWLDRVAWDKIGAALAVVCREYDIAVRRASVEEMRRNPKVRAFYGHDDMRRAWGGTTHTDPGPNFPWDRLISAVNTALAGEEEIDEVDPKELVRELLAHELRTDSLAGPGKSITVGDLLKQGLTARRLIDGSGPVDHDRSTGSPIPHRSVYARLDGLETLVDNLDEAVIARLGSLSATDLADVLRQGLTPQQVVELIAALNTPA
jgi:N-acetyl-anhydromuramyl-L-alanine amidase AmpD